MTSLFLWKNFWTLTVTGLTNGAMYALVALGYTLVYGILRLINFAHSEVFLLGTFGSIMAATWILRIPQTRDGKYPYEHGLALVVVLIFLLVVAMICSAATALVIERTAYRPLRGAGDKAGAIGMSFLTAFVVSLLFSENTKVNVVIAAITTFPLSILYLRLFKRGRQAPRLAFLISAIGASTAISEAVATWGPKTRNQYFPPRVLQKSVLFQFFDTDVRIDQLIVFVGALLMMVALSMFVGKTRLGRGMRAVAQDPETARIMGVNIDLVILVTFLLGGLMAGGAGMMFTLAREQTRFDAGFVLGVKAFTAAVLGGIGNLKGALIGGLLLGMAENYGAGAFGGQWTDVISFVVLLVVLMFRPTGLLGETLGRARA